MDGQTAIDASLLKWDEKPLQLETGEFIPAARSLAGEYDAEGKVFTPWEEDKRERMQAALAEITGGPVEIAYSHSLGHDALRIEGQQSIDNFMTWLREQANAVHDAGKLLISVEHQWVPGQMVSTFMPNMQDRCYDIVLPNYEEAIRVQNALHTLGIPGGTEIEQVRGGHRLRLHEEGTYVLDELHKKPQDFIVRDRTPDISRTPIPDAQTLQELGERNAAIAATIEPGKWKLGKMTGVDIWPPKIRRVDLPLDKDGKPERLNPSPRGI